MLFRSRRCGNHHLRHCVVQNLWAERCLAVLFVLRGDHPGGDRSSGKAGKTKSAGEAERDHGIEFKKRFFEKHGKHIDFFMKISIINLQIRIKETIVSEGGYW